MLRSGPFLRAWFTLIALAIVAVPVSGAHLHLCFDGAEAPATFHPVEDGGTHGDPAVDRGHHDTDVSLQGTVLAKKLDAGLDLPTGFLSTRPAVRLPIAPPVIVPRDDVHVPVPIRTARLLPPLRAPPV
ncbi:MAG: hypothetical protein WDO56_06755 [Gammaproteobacteria bacterium]